MKVLEIISSKWNVLTIAALSDGGRHYGEIRRRIEGISQKMLTQTLRQLERDGLVARCAHPTVPPSVEYELTPIGHSVLKHLVEMRLWVDLHYHEIEQARMKYDEESTLLRRNH